MASLRFSDANKTQVVLNVSGQTFIVPFGEIESIHNEYLSLKDEKLRFEHTQKLKAEKEQLIKKEQTPIIDPVPETTKDNTGNAEKSGKFGSVVPTQRQSK
jgi:hypothetical protein